MSRKINSLSLVFLVFLFIPGFLFAQSPRELRFGTWVTGTLSAGGEEWFSVQTTESCVLIVETSGNIDTYLEAYDASRALIDEDDDSGSDFNARLEIFAEANKTYLFKLSYWDKDLSGPYRIMAAFDPLPLDTERNTERSRAVLLQSGQAVPVYFRSPSESRWYSCNVSGSDKLFVAYTSGNLDTLLVFYDSQGRELGENDDSEDGFNARLSVPVNSGTIYIEVKTYLGKQGRSTLFTEIRERGKPDQYEPDDTMATAKDIRVGEWQERTFTDASDVDWVRLVITQTDFYEIQSTAMETWAVDSFLELYDSNGNLIADDDDSAGQFDARIIERLFPGTYYIKARCYDSHDLLEDNRYTLSVQRVEAVG